MRFFLAVFLAVAFNVSAYGQQSTEGQLADALRLIEQLELERDLAQLEADEAKLAARRDQIALRQAQLEIEQLKAQLNSDNANAGTPTVEASVDLAKRDGQVEETATLRCSASSPEVCTDTEICRLATYGRPKRWHAGGSLLVYSDEAKRRDLNCGVAEQSTTGSRSPDNQCSLTNFSACAPQQICERGTYGNPKGWITTGYSARYADEAKRRGLTCGVVERAGTTSSTSSSNQCSTTNARACTVEQLCDRATYGNPKRWFTGRHETEAKRRGLTCGVAGQLSSTSGSSSGQCRSTNLGPCNEQQLCLQAVRHLGEEKSWYTTGYRALYAGEAQRRGLTCGIGGSSSRSTSSSSSSSQRNTTSNASSSASGCTASGRGFGMAESLFWHRTASVACKREHFERECRGFGFAAGTPAMAQCVATQSNNSRSRASQRLRDFEMDNRSLTCRESGFGNMTCSPY